MQQYIISPEIFEKIKELSLLKNLKSLMLKSNSNEVDKFILKQATIRQKFAEKFPSLFQTQDILFPESINCEQSSSELTAYYKAKIVNQIKQELKKYKSAIHLNSLLDTTCGFSLDTFAFSNELELVVAFDTNEELISINQYNSQKLGISNIEYYCVSVNDFVDNFRKNKETLIPLNEKLFDVIYSDPSRRDNRGDKVFKLEDLQPNILELIDDFRLMTSFFILKLSPLIDIHYIFNTFDNIYKVYLIESQGELKEIVVVFNFLDIFPEDKGKKSVVLVQIKNKTEIKEKTIVLPSKIEKEFDSQKLSSNQIEEKYDVLYEPSLSELKLAYWQEFSLFKKVAANTHYFFLNEKEFYKHHKDLESKYFGKFYKILFSSKLDRSGITKLGITKANVKVRNAKIKPQEVFRKLKIKEGGDYYIFVFEDNNNLTKMLITKKI